MSKPILQLVIDTISVGALIAFLLPASAAAQSNAQQRAANLRSQLLEVEARQTELQTRLQQLDEQIKPENIEHSLAGVGSVHPEDLREARRRQLETERRGIQSQLEVLAASRSRLEAAITRADSESYLQSAGGVANNTLSSSAVRQSRKAHRSTKRRPTNRKPRKPPSA